MKRMLRRRRHRVPPSLPLCSKTGLPEERGDPDGVKMQGWLKQYQQRGKIKWKVRYCVVQVLQDRCFLCFYGPRKWKPKNAIDLSTVYVYPVHPSLLGRECYLQSSPVFQLITHLGTSAIFLQCEKIDYFQDWMSSIRPHCSAQLFITPWLSGLKEIRQAEISIIDLDGIPGNLCAKLHYSVAFNGVKVSESRKISWESTAFVCEVFAFDCIPTDVNQISVNLWSQRKQKHIPLGEVAFDLNDISSREDSTEWYSMIARSSASENCRLRLRLRFDRNLVMPVETYSILGELVQQDLSTMQALAGICSGNELLLLTNSLLRIYAASGNEMELLQRLAQLEIEAEENPSLLFRQESLATHVISMYLRRTCTPFLEEVFRPTFKDIVNVPVEQKEKLVVILDALVNRIFSNVDLYPQTIRFLCGFIRQSLLAKWPDADPLLRNRGTSMVIFLRWLCSALISPEEFSLTPALSEPSRTAALLSNTLQKLSNLMEFRATSRYEFVNPWILANKPKMLAFLENVADNSICPPVSKSYCAFRCLDLAQELATLHRISSAHLPELRSRCVSDNSLGSLLSVTEKLDKHQERYLDILGF